jgi:hypothetical protein
MQQNNHLNIVHAAKQSSEYCTCSKNNHLNIVDAAKQSLEYWAFMS